MGFSTVRCGKRINADDSEACKLEKAPSGPPMRRLHCTLSDLMRWRYRLPVYINEISALLEILSERDSKNPLNSVYGFNGTNLLCDHLDFGDVQWNVNNFSIDRKKSKLILILFIHLMHIVYSFSSGQKCDPPYHSIRNELMSYIKYQFQCVVM